MNDRAAIEQLARLVGIEAHYTDTFGRSHQASDETLLALIGALVFQPTRQSLGMSWPSGNGARRWG